MRHPIIRLFVMLAVVITAGCGFHPRGTTQVPSELKTLIVSTGNPYGPLARTVRQQLRINDVKIVEDSKQNRTDIPTLRLGLNPRAVTRLRSLSAAPLPSISW